MADTMRGVYTNLTDIRRDVFCEVAKIMYSIGEHPEWSDAEIDDKFDELPYKILPGAFPPASARPKAPALPTMSRL
jgi:hypothetical protein